MVSVFFATILLTSTVALSLPNLLNGSSGDSPANRYAVDQQAKFCGFDAAKSNKYITEYKIPTECTNPLAITSDKDGNVWFVQSNTGKIVKFNPQSKSFTEFDNAVFPKSGVSMMWGVDQTDDGSFWFTDAVFQSIWKFSPSEKTYSRLGFPTNNTLPQKIQAFGSDLIYNDFTGGTLSILTPSEKTASIFSVPQIFNGSVAGDFAVDERENIWYTAWIPKSTGALVQFDYGRYMNSQTNNTMFSDYVNLFALPSDATAIYGMDVSNGKIWMADSASSYFFSFDPVTKQFTKYITSDPPQFAYGNVTGIIKTPVSGPYWIKSTDDGKIAFNEQTANRIALMDTKSESLVEYAVPSKNPNWADCGNRNDCGLAQVFDFTVNNDKVWFTEWAQNNIGVLDTSIEIPIKIELDTNTISLKPGESKNLSLNVITSTNVSLITSKTSDSLSISLNSPKAFVGSKIMDVTISASQESVPGTYKVLLGAQAENVYVSKFVTVIIES
jgi:virginiamycin B lyase